GLLASSGHRATGGRSATALAAPLAKLATAIIGALSAALAAPTVAGTPLSCLLAATCTTGAGAMLATWLVVQTQAQADALPVDVDVHHLHLDHLTGVDHRAGVLDESVRHRGDVDEAVLVHADVDEGAEGGHISHRALQHHAGAHIGDLLHALGQARGLEARAWVAAWLIQLCQHIAHRQHTESLV